MFSQTAFSSIIPYGWPAIFVCGPTVLLASSIALFTLSIVRYRSQILKTEQQIQRPVKNTSLSIFSKFIIILCCFVLFTYIADAVVIITHAIITPNNTNENTITVAIFSYYIIASWFAWVFNLISFIVNGKRLKMQSDDHASWIQQQIFWIEVIGIDSLVGWCWLSYGLTLKPGEQPGTEPSSPNAAYDHFLFSIFVVRYVVESLILSVFSMNVWMNNRRSRTTHNNDASSPLLSSSTATNAKTSTTVSTSKTQYGAITKTTITTTTTTTVKKRKKKTPPSTFRSLAQKTLHILLPRKSSEGFNFKIYILVLLCFCVMALGFIVNLWAPWEIGHIIDDFKQKQQEPQPSDPDAGVFDSISWQLIIIYIALKFVQGNNNSTNLLESFIQTRLNIPIMNHIKKEIMSTVQQRKDDRTQQKPSSTDVAAAETNNGSTGVFTNSNSKRDEDKQLEDGIVIQRGTNATVKILNLLLFHIFPFCINVILTSLFVSYIYGRYFGIIILITMFTYLCATLYLSQHHISIDGEEENIGLNATGTDVEQTSSTASPQPSGREGDTYLSDITEVTAAVASHSVGNTSEEEQADLLNAPPSFALNLAQNMIVTGGLLVGCLLFAYEVARGRLSPGDFVAFNVYLVQLCVPVRLRFYNGLKFGTEVYKRMQKG
ncbi:hypothetical protein BDF20DRAFT_240548 [Mycotypha africana]|uniref:uncharacterized protein n=1 Tax=Mycotypha africana TaxID=64632 RepID=UPI00230003E0|nr:uncharacterized protein BDF20DRAFT_240548 [Mycotypha africana]KAI8967289.1 hypothetical protein BDF20DRAFT_240548 [Mycotypha africana]